MHLLVKVQGDKASYFKVIDGNPWPISAPAFEEMAAHGLQVTVEAANLQAVTTFRPIVLNR